MNNEVLKFGVYEVDSRQSELRRNGVKVKLQEQPFQLLSLLLERPGEIVSRDDLQKRLWPSDTFVDFDHGLNAAVRRLRDALGDSADNPRFVETVSRRGYRFLAPVSRNGLANGLAETNGHSALIRNRLANGNALAVTSSPQSSKRRAWAIVGLVVLTGAGVSVGWHAGHARRDTAIVPSEERLTANSSDAPVSGAAISPNGKLLAYVDPRGIFLREIDSGEVHALPLPENFRAHDVHWFPDGDHLLATASGSWTQPAGLWNIPVLGGAPQNLAESAYSGSVSPDGKQIAFFRGDDKINNSKLFVVGSDGGEPRQVLELGGFSVGAPAWSPDGRKLAFLKLDFTMAHVYDNIDLEILELASGQVSKVVSDDLLDGGVVWGPDGRIFFSRVESNPNQTTSNVWVARLDPRTNHLESPAVRLTSGPDSKWIAGASLDGKRLAFMRTNIQPSIYVAQVNARTRELSQVEKLTLDEQQNRPYEWTPDGNAVIYISNREGGFHIFRQRPGQANPDLLVRGNDIASIVRLNPDGSELLYLTQALRPEPANSAIGGIPPNQDTREAGNEPLSAKQTPVTPDNTPVRIMRAPIGGGSGRVLLEAPAIPNFQCARAPSQVCVFSQLTADGISFFEFDPQTGAKTELPRAGNPQGQAYNWSLSPDGRTLALAKKTRASEEPQLRLVPIKAGTDKVLYIKGWTSIATIDWAADSKSMWAAAEISGELRALLNIDLEGNAKSVLVEKRPYMGWAIPSPDGKKLAFWESTGVSNVWMLKGF